MSEQNPSKCYSNSSYCNGGNYNKGARGLESAEKGKFCFSLLSHPEVVVIHKNKTIIREKLKKIIVVFIGFHICKMTG